MQKDTPLWGTSNSVMAISHMKKSEVEKMLPPAVALSPQNFTAADEHPIVFQINKQKIRVWFSAFKIDYYEFIPLIPLVHFRDNPSKYYQMSPILYVDSQRVVWGAQLLWNLNKVYATFLPTFQGTHILGAKAFSVKTMRNGIKAVQMKAVGEGKVGKATDFFHFQEFEPYLSADAIINSPNHEYWTASYHMKTAGIQGASVHFDLNMPELPELEKVQVRSITEARLGGFNISFRWELDKPERYYPQVDKC